MRTTFQRWSAHAAAVAVGFAMLVVVSYSTPRTDALDLPGRFTEGRLCGFEDASPKPGQKAYAAVVSLQKQVNRAGGTPVKALHARGVMFLLSGNIDVAVSTLQRAAALDRRSAGVLNDLAVVLLERARRQGSARDLVAAFEAVDEAAQMAPNASDARFNRALIIERLGFVAESREAWRNFLATDRASSWSREGAENLRKLSVIQSVMTWEHDVTRFDAAAVVSDIGAIRAIVQRHPQEARVHFEDDLVGQWAEAEAAGDTRKSERALQAVRAAAAALFSVTHNPLPARAVEAMDASQKAPLRRAALIGGLVAYHKGMFLYRNLRIKLAEPYLADARVLLERAQSPLASLALFYSASCRSYNNDVPGTIELLHETERQAVRDRLADAPLFGHVQWVRGRTLLNSGLPYSSLLCLQQALGIFERVGESESTAALHDLLAWNYEFLGDEDQAWSQYITALHTVGQANSRRQRIILNDFCDYATSHGWRRLALLASSSLVELGRTSGIPSDLARSLVDRSRARHVTADISGARADLAEARMIADTVDDARVRANLDTDLAAAETEVAATGDTAATLALFDHAIEAVVRTGRQTMLPRLWIERARVAAGALRSDEAERSLREAIAVIEKYRQRVRDADLSVDFAEEWYRAFDMMVELLVREHRTLDALEYVERSRARVLVEAVDGNSGTYRDNVDKLCRSVPDGVAVLVYATMERSTAVWLVRRGSTVFQQLPLGRSAVQELVEAAARVTADADPDAAKHALGALHASILGPILPLLRPEERVVFAPDAVLQSVPFAALYDSARRRWLVEDRAIGVVPSLHLFVTTLARDRALAARGRDRILILGDPAFDVERFPTLPRLHWAAAETQRIAALYPDAFKLVGARATRTALFAHSAEFPIVHIATHALVNTRHPSRSALVLAREAAGTDPGIMYAFEINRRAFSSTRLLILAGCRTATGRRTRYEGPLGMARSFLAAGVPEILATLWDVDDAASAALLLRFHERLRKGEDAPTALRSAQIALIHHVDPQFRRVDAWAGLQLIGGFFQN